MGKTWGRKDINAFHVIRVQPEIYIFLNSATVFKHSKEEKRPQRRDIMTKVAFPVESVESKR